ncbi:hypothetical protein DXG01_016052, partial [Tephrocybe rancida]
DALNVRDIGLKLDRPRTEDLPLLKKPPLKHPVTISSPAVVPPDSPPGQAITQAEEDVEMTDLSGIEPEGSPISLGDASEWLPEKSPSPPPPRSPLRSPRSSPRSPPSVPTICRSRSPPALARRLQDSPPSSSLNPYRTEH